MGGLEENGGRETPGVLFVVGVDDTMSIPLELAGTLCSRGCLVDVVAHRNSNNRMGGTDLRVRRIDGSRYSGKGWLRLFLFVLRSDREIVHVHHTGSGLVGSLAARVRGRWVVSTQHNDLRRSRGVLGRAMNLLTLFLSHVVVFNSNYTRETLPRALGARVRQKCVVIHNGVHVGTVREVACGGRVVRPEPNMRILCSVGKMIRQKDHKTLLEAFSLARAEASNPSHLVLVGDGPLRGDLECITEQLGLVKDVTFKGKVPREEVLRTLGNSDIFVTATRYEGFGNAVVEALAAGKPVVTTQAEAVLEVLGGVGRTAAIGDVEDLGRVLAEIIDCNEDDLRGMSRRSRRRADEFDLQACASKHELMYDDLLRAGRG